MIKTNRSLGNFSEYKLRGSQNILFALPNFSYGKTTLNKNYSQTSSKFKNLLPSEVIRMKQIFRTAYNIFATMCLGIFLLIPIVNIYLLRMIIHQETGIKTDYWKRPTGKDMYGKWRFDNE